MSFLEINLTAKEFETRPGKSNLEAFGYLAEKLSPNYWKHMKVPKSVGYHYERDVMDFENHMRECLSAASPQEKLVLIGNYFTAARNESNALAASEQAVRFITTNSSLVNAPLREGEISTNLQNFRDAVDYWIQHAPDYGQQRQVDRRVNFSPEFLEEIFNEGILTDKAFTATTKTPMDPDATYPFRNTLLHIDSKWAADVSRVSPDGHIQEHLLPSHARFQIVKAHIEKHDLEDDFPGAHPVKAHLWLKQVEPVSDRQVPDPWTGGSTLARREASLIPLEPSTAAFAVGEQSSGSTARLELLSKDRERRRSGLER